MTETKTKGEDFSPFGRFMLASASLIDQIISQVSRFIILLTGITLTLIMTYNVVSRYFFANGGFAAAQEIPERLFPWFIMAGIVLAAQAGSHMAVETLYEKLSEKGKVYLLIFGSAIIVISYLILFKQALDVAEITKIERSPILQLPNSHGYFAMAMGCLMLAIAHITSSIRIYYKGIDAYKLHNFKDITQ